MIAIKDVTVSKAGRNTFRQFSFEIDPGENWIIQGDNGSGKTMLLQLIAGEINPLSGRVHYSFLSRDDWDSRYNERREKIHLITTEGFSAFLGRSAGFYQQRYYTMGNTQVPKVRDVFGADIKKLKDLGVSDNFRIDDLLNLPITRLSNGQLKKIMILRQLVRDIPKLLLLDYPFDGLDGESRSDLSLFIDDISNRFGIQIILVDHGHALPTVINRRLVLKKFQIERIENVAGQVASTETKPDTIVNRGSDTGEPVVEMQNLTIEYGGKKVLSNVNWQINKGERWALTGRNGSGKTTLFSLIYADHPMAYSQRVFLFGRRRGTGESIWDIKKRVSYMGPEQIHFLDPKGIMLTGREYILLQSHSKPGRLKGLIDFFDAEGYIDVPVRFLSSGQLQMILLFNTFIDDKELLLLDEPFQFLDPHNHAKLSTYLNNYLDSEITLVLITHDERDVVRWTRKRKQL